MKEVGTIDEYIAGFSGESKQRLEALRQAVSETVPEAAEAISYGMPTYRLNGKNMIHFAAFEHHVGFYATPDGHAEFESELNKYKRGKGSVQFPYDQPLPLDLVKRICLYRAQQLTKGA